MNIETRNNDIILNNVSDFKISDVFLCGQCFRFNSVAENEYIGTAFGKTIRISQNESCVILHSTTMSDFKNVWYKFFDFDRDYSQKTYTRHS